MAKRPKASLADLANVMTPEAAESVAKALEKGRVERLELRRRQLGL